jgi:hypothetical protein
LFGDAGFALQGDRAFAVGVISANELRELLRLDAFCSRGRSA